MNAIQFIKEHGVEKARKVIEGAPETATHFTEALGGHYAKEGMLKMKPQWLWFNSINKEWYYDFAAKDQIHLPDLKSLVLRLDLIDRLGGINKASELFVKYQHLGESCFQEYLQCSSRSLEQAIADYEQLFGNTERL